MKQDLTRKQFLHLGLGATAAAMLPACGSDDATDTGAGTSSGTDPTTNPTGPSSDPTADSSSDPTNASTSHGSDPSASSGHADSSGTDPSATDATVDSSGGHDSSGGSSSGSAPGACDADPSVAIAGDPAHMMAVSLAEVQAGVEVVYDIMGTSQHSHLVTLSAEDFATLQETGSVMVVSTPAGGGHTHSVTVTCP